MPPPAIPGISFSAGSLQEMVEAWSCGRPGDRPADFGSMCGMRTMIILATVAFGALNLMLRTLAPTHQLEWTADE